MIQAIPGRSAAPSCGATPSRRSATVMRAVQFRPCIDIHKGKVKQIVGSTLQDLKSGGDAALQTNFESDNPSSWFAELYKEDGLRGGHVIMLGADDASKQAACAALGAYPGGLQLGGGVTTDNAAEYLEAGASHVIVTSYVFRDGRLEAGRLADLVKLVGKQRLVLDLSCRKKEDGKYYVVTDRWQKFSDLALSEASLAELAASCDEFLVHGVDVEGMQLGIDDELVALLGAWSPIPVTYAGGARTLDDLERVRRAGNGRVDITVGSALDIFGGKLPYQEVVAWHKAQQAQAGLPDAAAAAAAGGQLKRPRRPKKVQEAAQEEAAAPAAGSKGGSKGKASAGSSKGKASAGSGKGKAPAGSGKGKSAGSSKGELQPDGSILYINPANAK